MEKQSPREQIALCVIVGNEPKRLDRCLTQFAPAVSEIVVVHATGAEAKSLKVAEVCQKHGAIYGIYANAPGNEWPHVDSFCDARQKSFDLASKPWALWVDADDTPGPNFAPALHELLEKHGDNFDAFALFHNVAGRGIAHNIRERLVRRDKGKWVNRIHENFQLGADARIAKCDEPIVIHLPDDEPKQGSNRNLTILESIPESERTISEVYHLHGEYMGHGRKAEAMELAKRALAHPDLKPTERYELCLNICELARPQILETDSAEYKAMLTALHSAYRTQPNRREALALLGAMHLDLGDLEKAEAYLRSMMALPRPAEKAWTHRDGLYGWAGETLWTQFLRMVGDLDKADAIEKARLKAQKEPTISIIHPTRGRPEQAAVVRKMFLDNAKNPERIEHIFGMEADSPDMGILGRFRHATSPAGNLAQTNCVAAANAAARASVGEILIYVQDDLAPPPLHWDERIVEALGGNAKRPAVVKIGDGVRGDDLICTPCLTRKAAERLGYGGGIYFDGYRSMFADTELTWRATKNKWIVPSDIVIRHLHPTAGGASHETTERSNSVENYRQGFDLFCQRNPDYLQANPGFVTDTEAMFAAHDKDR
jgi:tetratricopeptide (TPR) repeat protein